MASTVEIANLALANLGDRATVTSLSPPDGSAQAEQAARFFGVARDTLLEMHPWNFATRRSAASLLAAVVNPWAYAYAMPAGAIRVLAVLPPNATDDYVEELSQVTSGGPVSPLTRMAQQPYAIERLATGEEAILTDQPDAVVRWVFREEDTTRWSPLFTLTMSWHLAAMLAGPLLRGKEGADAGVRAAQMTQAYLAQARTSDARQHRQPVTHTPSWLAGR